MAAPNTIYARSDAPEDVEAALDAQAAGGCHGLVIISVTRPRLVPLPPAPRVAPARVAPAGPRITDIQRRIRSSPLAIAGYAAKFNVISPRMNSGPERLLRGSFDYALSNDWLSFLLLDHRDYRSGARALAAAYDGTFFAEEDRHGLWIEASLRGDTEGIRVFEQASRGFLTGLSVGSIGVTFAMVDGVRVVSSIGGWEVSIVEAPSWPAREQTWVASIDQAIERRGRQR